MFGGLKSVSMMAAIATLTVGALVSGASAAPQARGTASGFSQVRLAAGDHGARGRIVIGGHNRGRHYAVRSCGHHHERYACNTRPQPHRRSGGHGGGGHGGGHGGGGHRR